MPYNPRHFVDRESQLAVFHQNLTGLERCSILLFRGPAGMGKTTILYRLRDICREAAVRSALVDLTGKDILYPEAVIQKLGSELRGSFYDAINQEMIVIECDMPRTSPQEQVLEAIRQANALPGYSGLASWPGDIQVQGNIGSVAAGGQAAIGTNIIQTQVIIHNASFSSPERGTLLAQEARLRRLSKVMREELETLLTQGRLVLLFDACDSAAEGVIAWLYAEILEPLIEGNLNRADNLAVVLVGDDQCERGFWLHKIVENAGRVAAYPLGNLPGEAVLKYWIEIRGLGRKDLPNLFEDGVPPYLLVQVADFAKGKRGD